MKILDACYELEFNKINFQERKEKITHPKTIVCGPPKTGKSYLIYDYLSNFNNQEYLYINLNDFRNHKDEIVLFLNDFIKEKKIKILVLENFDFDFELPEVQSILITSSNYKEINGFKTIFVHGLDFEEYLLHDNKYQNSITSFNHFLKYGNLPEMIVIDENKRVNRLQEIVKLFCKDTTEIEVLKLLFSSIDENKSINQLYTILKKSIKISKDRFYELCKFYEANQLIFFIKKYNHEKSTKKIYAYNHAFLNSISHNKKFKNEFTNMVFLQLQKEHKNIYYLDKIDFFIEETRTLVLAIPFFNTLLNNTIIKKIYSTIDELNIQQVYIITAGNNDTLKYKKVEINILPFYEWAVQ
ncbi:MAG: ATP-binding protein [Arcobacter sp.]|uniref:ATP-binding protein n=1 Tax=Arcobacter sp. TaxID=1872629 RepID=UPI003C71E22C